MRHNQSDNPFQESLEQNIRVIDDQLFISAGDTHFRSFWTRDFLLAVPGLLSIEREEAAESHLTSLLESDWKSHGQLPRLFDTRSSASRIVFSIFKKNIGLSPRLGFGPKAKPEFQGEHGTPSVDGALLAIWASAVIAEKKEVSPDFATLSTLFRQCVQPTMNADGLISQPPFSDWQDSARREGVTFLTNLMLWKCLKILQSHLDLSVTADEVKNSIHQKFWQDSQQLYNTHLDLPEHFSVDGNLLAILWDFAPDNSTLYESLKRHSLGQHWGVATAPNYPRTWISWTCWFVGLSNYHGALQWSWLSGLSAVVALKMKDLKTAKSILCDFENRVKRDGWVYEVYNPKTTQPVRTLLYSSEGPFAWGAGWLTFAFETLRELEPKTPQ